ncbi:hypothetical protein A4X09_0g4418 [Tilletia walkeri]|uniref:Dynein light intermediate chain n=1 Tax=Tilletia walkeri TaxID=117179 RepID=A0A8X7T401_9BASI|nr:hypothetical protein A4X09_0g4418 [Tilletia walkeri]
MAVRSDDSFAMNGADMSFSTLIAAPAASHSIAGGASSGAHQQQVNGGGAQDGSEEQEDLWSSILNSVQSTRAVPTKNVLILGEPSTGKSTLLQFLAERSPASYINASGSAAALSATAAGAGAGQAAAVNNKAVSPMLEQGGDSVLDLGLSYGYWDAGDEDGDVVARIGVYQLSSSHPNYRSLLPFAFPAPSTAASSSESGPVLPALLGGSGSSKTGPAPSPAAMLGTCIVITLDWSQPWTFLSQLRTWMETIRSLVVAAQGQDLPREAREADAATARRWRAAEIALEEMREKLEAFLRAYIEPGTNVLALSADSTSVADGMTGMDPALASSDGPTINVPAASSLAFDREAQLPLGDGILNSNFGVPIIVVCTKADLMAKLERDRDFKEEQFDYIQQVLRTVCLKYGAALFYTSHTRPQSFDILRSYVLHRLFPPAPTTGAGAGSAEANVSRPGDDGGAGTTGVSGGAAAISFPFNHRAATLAERETLLVPTGWDTWGKINALREGFDCKGWGLGWDFDCEVERRRRLRQIQARLAQNSSANAGESMASNVLTAPGLSRGGNASDQGSNTPRARQAEEAEIEKEVGLDIRPEDRGVGSAVRLYEDIVSDVEGNLSHHAPTPSVRSPDDQEFLQQWYATLATKKDEGQASSAATAALAAGGMGGGVGSAGQTGSSAAAAALASSGLGGRDSPRPMSPGISEYLQNATGARAGATGSPMSGARSSTRQSEVLHSFFQSLLEGTESGGGARRGGLARGARAGTPGASSGAPQTGSNGNANGDAGS